MPELEPTEVSKQPIMHCECCGRNSVDQPFSINDTTLASSSPKQCLDCYWQWWPFAQFVDWPSYVNHRKENPDFNEKLDIARNQIARGGFHNSRKRVVSGSHFGVRISRPASLLQKRDIKTKFGKVTPTQLKLKKQFRFASALHTKYSNMKKKEDQRER